MPHAITIITVQCGVVFLFQSSNLEEPGRAERDAGVATTGERLLGHAADAQRLA